MEFGEEIRDILLQDDRRVTSLSWNNQEGIEQIALRTWSPLNGALTSETVFQAETWPDQGFLVGDEAYLINMDDKVGFC